MTWWLCFTEFLLRAALYKIYKVFLTIPLSVVTNWDFKTFINKGTVKETPMKPHSEYYKAVENDEVELCDVMEKWQRNCEKVRL